MALKWVNTETKNAMNRGDYSSWKNKISNTVKKVGSFAFTPLAIYNASNYVTDKMKTGISNQQQKLYDFTTSSYKNYYDFREKLYSQKLDYTKNIQQAKYKQDLFGTNIFEKLGFGVSDEEKYIQDLMKQKIYYNESGNTLKEVQYIRETIPQQVQTYTQPSNTENFFENNKGVILIGLGVLALFMLSKGGK